MEPRGAIIPAGPLHAETSVLSQESVPFQSRTDVPGEGRFRERWSWCHASEGMSLSAGTGYSWHLVSRKVRRAVSYLKVHGTPRPSKKKIVQRKTPVVLRPTLGLKKSTLKIKFQV